MNLGVTAAGAALSAGTISAAELVHAHLRRIETVNGGAPSAAGAPRAVNAWVRLYPEQALAQAVAADRRRAAEGSGAPALCGVPIGLKDLYAVRGLPVTGSSDVLAGNVATRDSVAWSRLAQRSSVLLGHLHTHELAAGATTDQCGNPWQLDRTTGGSSGGSAAAVAARMVPAALGTDTAGSLRIPAALCGVSAVKPTHGRVPTEGIVPLSPTLDTSGPIARTVADCGAILAVLAAGGAAFGAQHPPAQPLGSAPSAHAGPRPLAGRRIALTGRVAGAALDADVAERYEQAVRDCERLGATVVELTAPEEAAGPGPAEDYMLVLQADMAAAHAGYADRRDRYQADLRAAVAALPDPPTPAARYVAAQQRRDALAAAWERWMAQHRIDALLEPTTPVVAFARGARGAPPPIEQAMRLWELTMHWNLTGNPVVALPAGVGRRTGLPVGVSLVGRRGAEQVLLGIGVDLQAHALPPLSPPEPEGGFR